MHDLLRAYAAELAVELPAADRNAGRTRLFDHYLDTAREAAAVAYGTSADSGQGSARRWLDAERANLLAVAATAIHETPEYTDGLAVVLSRYLDTGGHYHDALAIDGLALRAARARGDSAAETAALGRLGVVHRRLGAYPEALDCLIRTLEIHRANGDRGSQAHALLGSEIGEADVKTRALIDAGEILHELGDRGRRQPVPRRARPGRGHRQHLRTSRALDGLARLDQQLGRLAEAKSHAATARKLFQELGVAEATQ